MSQVRGSGSWRASEAGATASLASCAFGVGRVLPPWPGFSLFASVQSHLLELGRSVGRSGAGLAPAVVPGTVLGVRLPGLPRRGLHSRPASVCSAVLTDAAPLSAPAFSLVFPMLKMVLTEMPYHSEEEEEQMAQILQILTVHAQLRASPDTPPERVDEVGRLSRPVV